MEFSKGLKHNKNIRTVMYVSSLLIVLQNDFCKLIVWLLYSNVFLVNVRGKSVCEQAGFSS